MGYLCFPAIAWLTLTGRWRMRKLRDDQAFQRAYILVPDGMTPEQAIALLHDNQTAKANPFPFPPGGHDAK